jgi:hypothetical protein
MVVEIVNEVNFLGNTWLQPGGAGLKPGVTEIARGT